MLMTNIAEIVDPIKVNNLEDIEHFEDVLPPKWTPEHVMQRLYEAMLTAKRLPQLKGPRQPGNHWPEHTYTFGEVRGWYELPPGELAERDREQNRTSVKPSAKDLSRLDACEGWIRWLRDRDSALANVLSKWGIQKALRRPMRALCEANGWSHMSLYRARDKGAKVIADWLNASGKAVF